MPVILAKAVEHDLSALEDMEVGQIVTHSIDMSSGSTATATASDSGGGDGTEGEKKKKKKKKKKKQTSEVILL